MRGATAAARCRPFRSVESDADRRWWDDDVPMLMSSNEKMNEKVADIMEAKTQQDSRKNRHSTRPRSISERPSPAIGAILSLFNSVCQSLEYYPIIANMKMREKMRCGFTTKSHTIPIPTWTTIMVNHFSIRSFFNNSNLESFILVPT